MGGRLIRVRRGRDPRITGWCPVCKAKQGQRCSGWDWTHKERLKLNHFAPNATRTRPPAKNNPGSRQDPKEARAAAEQRERPKQQPWEYDGIKRQRRVDNGM